MVVLFTGANTFALNQAQNKYTTSFNGEVELVDAQDMPESGLVDLILGQDLFSTSRLIVLKNPDDNPLIWNALPKWLEKSDESLNLILIQPSVDKRTSTYKWLQKHAEVKLFETWSSRNHAEAITWLTEHAKQQGVALDNKLAQELLKRVGYNQWHLHNIIEKLSLRAKDSKLTIDDIVDSSAQDNVFELLQAALDGNETQVLKLATRLKQTEDPYAVFGLLASQITQLAVLSLTDAPAAQIASDTGLHPYSLQKLKPYARQMGKEKVALVAKRLAKADRQIKSSDVDVWTVLEQQLLHIART